MACRSYARAGHQDLHEDVVVRVAHVVAGRLLADDQRAHVDRGHEVGRPEDDRLGARRGGGDGVDVGQAHRVLDLGLDADAPDLVAHRLLDLGEQHVQRVHLLGVLHLRQHDRVQGGARSFDDLGHVAVGPLGGPVVDPDHACLALPTALVEGGDDGLARPRLGQRGAGVLEVEEDLVRRQRPGLVDELLARPRHRQAGPARTVHGTHVWDDLLVVGWRGAPRRAHGHDPGARGRRDRGTSTACCADSGEDPLTCAGSGARG